LTSHFKRDAYPKGQVLLQTLREHHQ